MTKRRRSDRQGRGILDDDRQIEGPRCSGKLERFHMKIVRFGRESGRDVARDGSSFTISRLAHRDGHPEGIHVACMYLDPGGLVGYHPASTFQLFIVVDGMGWVQCEDRRQIPIEAGEAAFWEPGERHGAGTESGKRVIVVEGDALGGDPPPE